MQNSLWDQLPNSRCRIGISSINRICVSESEPAHHLTCPFQNHGIVGLITAPGSFFAHKQGASMYQHRSPWSRRSSIVVSLAQSDWGCV